MRRQLRCLPFSLPFLWRAQWWAGGRAAPCPPPLEGSWTPIYRLLGRCSDHQKLEDTLRWSSIDVHYFELMNISLLGRERIWINNSGAKKGEVLGLNHCWRMHFTFWKILCGFFKDHSNYTHLQSFPWSLQATLFIRGTTIPCPITLINEQHLTRGLKPLPSFWRSSVIRPPSGGRGRERREKTGLGNPGRGKNRRELFER